MGRMPTTVKNKQVNDAFYGPNNKSINLSELFYGAIIQFLLEISPPTWHNLHTESPKDIYFVVNFTSVFGM